MSVVSARSPAPQPQPSASSPATFVQPSFVVNLHMREKKSDKWICALCIPLEDIKRLTLRPLKWLRFVVFAILGSQGDLFDSEELTGGVVDHGTEFKDMAKDYYYVPTGDYHLIDPNGLTDRVTSTARTERAYGFRHEVAQRDGNFCVVTRTIGRECDAAHIIPRSKGNDYINFVISDRRGLYKDLPSDLDIDSPENGMFLSAHLHRRFGNGRSAFLRTPNFVLGPNDIPRVELGTVPPLRTTFQHIEQWEALNAQPQRDVRADWSVPNAPLSIFLDYTYGVAVIKHWATSEMKEVLKQRYEKVYINPPHKTASPPSEPQDDNGDNSVEPDDPADTDYVPPRYHGNRQDSSSLEAEQCRAMDMAFAFSMFFRGYPPGTTVAMVRQEQEEAAEVHTRQLAQEKVQNWLGKSASFSGGSGGGE